MSHQLSNDLRLRILRNEKILVKGQNWVDGDRVCLMPSLPSKIKAIGVLRQNTATSRISNYYLKFRELRQSWT